MNVGDQVKVKVIGFDERGKVKLSMRVVDQETGEDITEKVGASPAAVIATGSGAIGVTRPEVMPEATEQPAIGE